MEESYLGEIKWYAGSKVPAGWAICDGSMLSIAANPALYNVIGTFYGGDGTNTFQLPDLRGRVAIGVSGTFALGLAGGFENIGLTSANLPVHTHLANAATATDTAPLPDPTGNFWAGNSKVTQFIAGSASDTNMNTLAIGADGGNQPHPNMPPFLVIGFIICTSGVTPPRP